MAKNPFKQQKEFAPSPNRNNFDCSFTNNGTYDFGTLYPVLCHEVLPGDTTVIDPRMALRAFPLVFPIQTRVRAHLHFFYQRDRNLWSGFTDFINGNKEATPPSSAPSFSTSPFISDVTSPSLFRTGSLGDYLGVPTTLPATISDSNSDFVPLSFFMPDDYSANEHLKPLSPYRVIVGAPDYSVEDNNLIPNGGHLVVGQPSDTSVGDYFITSYSGDIANNGIRGNNSVSNIFRFTTRDYNFNVCYGAVAIGSSANVLNVYHKRFVLEFPSKACELYPDQQYALLGHDPSVKNFVASNYSNDNIVHSGEIYNKIPVTVSSFVRDGQAFTRVVADLDGYKTNASATFILFCGAVKEADTYDNRLFRLSKYSVYDLTTSSDYIDSGYSVFGMRDAISALPFRCYESIYNAFYRDSRNNPFVVDGEPAYNTYLASTDGGLDRFPYALHKRNWELDMFTSSVQSPQQGIAPLVGISSTGDVTFSDENGKSYTFATETADDADTITNVKVTENVPNSVARSIVNLVSSGISINDFRNVNAFQRWKETNIRRGLKFKDQIKARWGVDVGYNTLDMPEFLGGMSVDLDINTVNQTSDSTDAPLGSYAGQASAFGSTNNKISCYSDEHGFIMCILSIVPVPCYTQTLPRYFNRFSPLDYYNPEFGKIGMQAITLKDLCPINAAVYDKLNPTQGTRSIDEVFGYNRPWPEYLSRLDEAHGDFRTTLKNFLLMREFSNLPELGPEFTTINSSDLNNVFATDYGDKFLGCIHFDMQCKRPIPEISVPSIE